MSPAVRDKRKRKPSHVDAAAPPADPEAEWWADLEHVWASRVRRDVDELERDARELRAAADRARNALEARRLGLEPADVDAPGVRTSHATRASLGVIGRRLRQRMVVTSTVVDRRGRKRTIRRPVRVTVYIGRDGRRIIVDGEHGCSSLVGRRVELLKSAEWREARAAAASMSRADVVGACRGRWRRVGCGCGVREIEVGCDQTTLCEWCRRRHWKRWRRRIVRAMGAHLRAARERWDRYRRRGRRGTSSPGVYLITLTVPHSGDIRADRRALARGWRAVSKAASYGGFDIRDRDGNVVRSSAAKWWGAHALVYEATPGTKGDGHLHAHVACISSWVPYHELRALWRETTGSVVVDVVDPSTQAARSKSRGFASNEAGTAAAYLAKYVTKGVDPREFTGRKAGELLAAFRGVRKVTTSEGFWRPVASTACSCCGERHRLVGAPVGLQEHAPHAVLASLAERTRWRPPRGSPQVVIRRAG